MADSTNRQQAIEAAKERARQRIQEARQEQEGTRVTDALAAEATATQVELTANEQMAADQRLTESGRVPAVGGELEQPDLGIGPGTANEAGGRNPAEAPAEGNDFSSRFQQSTNYSPETQAALDVFNQMTGGNAPTTSRTPGIPDTDAGSWGNGSSTNQNDYNGAGVTPTRDDISTVFGVDLDGDWSTVVPNSRQLHHRAWLQGREVDVQPDGTMTWINDDGSMSTLDPGSGTVTTVRETETSTTTTEETASGEAPSAPEETVEIEDDPSFRERVIRVRNAVDGTSEESVFDALFGQGEDPTGENMSAGEQMRILERFEREFGVDPATGGRAGANPGDGRTDPADYTTPETGAAPANARDRLRGGDDPLAPGANGEVSGGDFDVVHSQDDVINYGEQGGGANPSSTPYEDVPDTDRPAGPISADVPGSDGNDASSELLRRYSSAPSRMSESSLEAAEIRFATTGDSALQEQKVETESYTTRRIGEDWDDDGRKVALGDRTLREGDSSSGPERQQSFEGQRDLAAGFKTETESRFSVVIPDQEADAPVIRGAATPSTAPIPARTELNDERPSSLAPTEDALPRDSSQVSATLDVFNTFRDGGRPTLEGRTGDIARPGMAGPETRGGHPSASIVEETYDGNGDADPNRYDPGKAPTDVVERSDSQNGDTSTVGERGTAEAVSRSDINFREDDAIYTETTEGVGPAGDVLSNVGSEQDLAVEPSNASDLVRDRADWDSTDSLFRLAEPDDELADRSPVDDESLLE